MNYSSIKRQLAESLTREISKHPSINCGFIAVEFNTDSDVKPDTACLTASYLLPLSYSNL